jgi:hypothetical protein
MKRLLLRLHTAPNIAVVQRLHLLQPAGRSQHIGRTAR